jgi:colicin import membrane protein
MKKLILSAIALVSLTCQAVAQAPEDARSVPVVTPPPAPTPAPAPPNVPAQPTTQKEKGEKHKGGGGERKEERPWENHGRKNKKDKDEHKGKKDEQGEHREEQGNRGQAKKAENEARKAERDAQGNRGQAKKAENEARKAEREEQGNRGQAKKAENEARKGERKEARAEKLDKMRAYLNLSPDQEARMSTAIQSFRTGAKAVKENKNLSADQKKAQFEKLAAERNAQLKSILTPDQLAKLAEAQKQGQAQGQGKGKHGFISEEMGDDDLF